MHVFLNTQSNHLSPNDSPSVSNSVIDSNHPRRLRPVSAQPVVMFPTEKIFQIDQCLEPFKQTVTSNDLVASQGAEFLFGQNVPSSVVSQQGDGTDSVSTKTMGVADAVRLPIDDDCGQLLSFNETLVVSRMEELDESVEKLAAIRSGNEMHPLLKVDRLVPMGGMSINVDASNGRFVINTATQFSFEMKQTAMATIQAAYTNGLELEYEKRCETLCARGVKNVYAMDKCVLFEHLENNY